MRASDALGEIAVAAPDCSKERCMRLGDDVRLRVRIGEGDGKPHALLKASQHLRKERVAGDRVERAMKRDVSLHQLAEIAARGSRPHHIDVRIEFIEHRALARSEPGAIALEHRAERANLLEVVAIELGDERTAVVELHDEAFADERRQRLANGCLAHPELARDPGLDDSLARLEISAENCLPQDLSYLVALQRALKLREHVSGDYR